MLMSGMRAVFAIFHPVSSGYVKQPDCTNLADPSGNVQTMHLASRSPRRQGEAGNSRPGRSWQDEATACCDNGCIILAMDQKASDVPDSLWGRTIHPDWLFRRSRALQISTESLYGLEWSCMDDTSLASIGARLMKGCLGPRLPGDIERIECWSPSGLVRPLRCRYGQGCRTCTGLSDGVVF